MGLIPDARSRGVTVGHDPSRPSRRPRRQGDRRPQPEDAMKKQAKITKDRREQVEKIIQACIEEEWKEVEAGIPETVEEYLADEFEMMRQDMTQEVEAEQKEAFQEEAARIRKECMAEFKADPARFLADNDNLLRAVA